MGTKTILTVDDEEHILELIAFNLENSGYKAIKAESGEQALTLLKTAKIDLIVLDWMLPGIDGIEVLRQIRTNTAFRKIPVILLTAKSDEISKVVGLEVGADDYLVKPFSIHELIARIKAVLRRTQDTFSEPDYTLQIDNIVIDKTKRRVTVGDGEIELSHKEFELLYFLAKNQGIVFSREHLLEKIWGYDYCGETRTVDVHIRNLRKKIELDDTNPQYLKTVRGVGYKFSEKKVNE